MPIETILLDLGNVLVPFDYRRWAKACAAHSGLGEEEILALSTGPLAHEIGTGRLHPHAFFERLGERAGRALARELCAKAWCEIFRVDGEMVRVAEALADRYPVFLWSNTDPLHFAYLRPQLPVLARFRGVHLSYEIGSAKPEPAYYERGLAKVKSPPERCLFIDDVPRNLAPARQLGICTLVHTSVASTRAHLERMGVL